jgi:type II secretory pathway pseudopilin PulG
MKKQRSAFSLVEVVVSLGIIAFAIVAIIGVVPLGLSTGRSAQDETRAPQIAQDVFASLASQAQTKGMAKITINPVYTMPPPGQPLDTTKTPGYDINLGSPFDYATLAADADGRLIATGGKGDLIKYPYEVLVQVKPNPPNFDTNAAQVTVRVISPPSRDPSQPPSAQQSVRDFVRIISKY